MKRSVIISIIIIFTFLIADNWLDILAYFGITIQTDHRYLLFWGVVLGIVLIISSLLFGSRKVLFSLGLNKGFSMGMGYGLAFTAPMFLGYAIIGEFRTDFTLYALFTTFVGAAMEEVLYRGFLFGQLFRFAKWKFVPAVLLNALIFGAAHLYQGSGIGDTAGIFLVTLVGGCWFAWLYVNWDYNLWIAIGLHFFMNLSWSLFSIDDTALGGWGANLFRIMTITLSIVFTILIKKRQDSGTPSVLKMN